MGTVYTAAFTTPAISTTGTLQRRTVSDKIRNLFPGAAQLFALVSTGKVEKGEVTKSPGLIGKKGVDTRRYEWFSYTPNIVELTVASTDFTDHTMSSVTGLVTKRTVVNERTLSVGRVSSITSLAVRCTAITSTFNSEMLAGDKLLIMAPAYPENSSGPLIVQKDDDQHYNVTQIMRFPVSISASAKGNPHYGGDFWGRLKEKNMIEGNRLVEHSYLFNERPSSADTTTDSIIGDTFGSFRGMWKWAANTFPCGGSMTPAKFQKDLPLAMSDTINPSQRVIMLTSRTILGEMLEWVNEKLAYIQGDSKVESFGLKTTKFITNGPTIEVVVHDAFDHGKLANKALCFVPDDCLYIFKNGRDLQPKQGIQNNDVDGYEDEILGELGFADLSGGNSITTITDWFAL
jgi:hypothetical protein